MKTKRTILKNQTRVTATEEDLQFAQPISFDGQLEKSHSTKNLSLLLAFCSLLAFTLCAIPCHGQLTPTYRFVNSGPDGGQACACPIDFNVTWYPACPQAFVITNTVHVCSSGYNDAGGYSCVGGLSVWASGFPEDTWWLSLSKHGSNAVIYGTCGDGITGTSPPVLDDEHDLGNAHSGDDCGMPVWRVSEPYISLWLKDEPLGYQPALGPRVSFELQFKQQEIKTGFDTNVFSAGKKWNFSWNSYVRQLGSSKSVVYFSNGGSSTYTNGADYLTNTRLTGNTNTGFTLSYPDGSSDIYGFIVTNSSGRFLKAYLSERRTPSQQGLHFNYSSYNPASPVIRLQSVVDGDGRTTTISYNATNAYSTNLISQVTDPFGRIAALLYDATGHLTNITDVAQLSSSFIYDTNEWVTNMTTPYGTTRFKITDTKFPDLIPNGRSILITKPDGGKELFLYTNNAPGIASSYATNLVPSTAPYTNAFDNTELNLRNTFHWGSRQYDALSTTNIASLTTNDFRKARMQHWLKSGTNSIGDTLSLERAPSPDSAGTVDGQITWYDYAGKTNAQYEGTQISPLFTASVLPDATTAFVRTDRNNLGNVLTNTSTYSSGGSIALRTSSFTYSSNGIDLLTAVNALGVRVSSNLFNAYHQVTASFDALNQLTLYTYNANQQLSTISLPNGLITTNIYGSDNWLASSYSYAAGPGGSTIYFGTNSFTYANDLIYSHTDARGLTTTNLYDNLQRLLKVTYPDGTFITNSYDKLDLVRVRDRMGFTNSFGFDNLQRLVATTNSLGFHTINSYCTCGALESTRDRAGNVTSFFYDNQGRATNVVYADGYSTTNFYNLIGQLVRTKDSANIAATNWYNNQGLLVTVSNALSRVQSVGYDILDRATTNTDINGLSLVATYDNLNRPLTRTHPDTGVEKFFYNVNGLIAYTNQMGQRTLYDYDAAGRKIAETNANLEVTRWVYSSAGDLRTLTDGKGNDTHFNYNEYGLTTNKVGANAVELFRYSYDANNRLTSRWSAAKGTTSYSYDAVGNLLTVVHPTSGSITNQYDSLGRLTNMLDSLGVTRYTFNNVGQLLSEDGPWASDTVTNTYLNRLLTSLSLQQPNASDWVQTYQYDSLLRLTNMTSPAGSFGYQYGTGGATSPVLGVTQLTLPNTAKINYSYDTKARLSSTTLKNNLDAVLNSHAYDYNLINQRIKQTRTEGDYVDYTYDDIGQLKTTWGKEAGGTTNRLNEQFRYWYDQAGNLNTRSNNNLKQTFNVNSMNELTTVERDTSSMLTVAGTTTSPATNVTVNGQTASRYADRTFARDGFTPLNGNNTYTAIANDSRGRTASQAITANLPVTATYTYDLNGNLLFDGQRAFAYDDENQLVRITVTNGWETRFAYDGAFRLRVRKEFTWSGFWVQTNEVHYVYSGNTVLEERTADNVPLVTYTRGLGGLLARSDFQLSTLSLQHSYYHADGNGNITALINASQLIVARYLYDPFGNTLALSGPLAELNRYRFSSKEFHAPSGTYYFGRRFYEPTLQRWLNRDSIAELGGHNLFGYVGNNPISLTDFLGLCENSWDVFLNGSMDSFWEALGRFGDSTGELTAIGFDMIYFSLFSVSDDPYAFTGFSDLYQNIAANPTAFNPGKMQEDILFGTWKNVANVGTLGYISVLEGTYKAADTGDYTHLQDAFMGQVITGTIFKATESFDPKTYYKVQGGCFVAGTLIATTDGFVEIQDIKIGDEVASYSNAEQQWQCRRVLNTFIHDYTGDVITITVAGESIQATGNHPFWVLAGENLSTRPEAPEVPLEQRTYDQNGRWVEARHLKSGDTLLSIKDEQVKIAACSSRQDHLKVYNFHVDGNHTYTVGNDGLLVHNNSILGNPFKDAPSGFSNGNLAAEVHAAFEQGLNDLFGTKKGHWIMKTGPGETGVDATYVGPASKYPGFKYAELKPYSQNSIGTFGSQLQNWNLPKGKTELFFYNKSGIIGSSGFKF